LIEITFFSDARHFEDQWDIKIKTKTTPIDEREKKTLEMGMEYMQKKQSRLLRQLRDNITSSKTREYFQNLKM